MINYITYRKSNASKVEVLILKVIAISMIVALVVLELTVEYNCI